MRLCEIEGCERKHHSKGLCNVHYKSWYRENNLEEERERDRLRYQTGGSRHPQNPEYNKQWLEANPDYKRQWREANREKCRNYYHNWRVARRGQAGTVTPGKPARLMEAQKGRCQFCGKLFGDATPHIDHIIPLSRGGLHDDSNLQLLCSRCNLSKGAKTHVEFALANGKLL